MTEARNSPEAPAPDAEPAADAAREALVAELEAAVNLEEGEALERAYVFEPVERRDVSFTLALVTKRLASDRLEMVAVGGRVPREQAAAHDFVRRARFPEAVLPEILAEFIDRCGVEGAMYREVSLADRDADPVRPLERLAELLAPTGDGS
jgi:hypothetical protein